MIKRRAINDEQKLERRQVILDKAWELLQASSYEAINIGDVAQQAGLAKGTVYLYFLTKEALFLAVLEQQFDSWFDEINTVLEKPAQPLNRDYIIQLFTTSIASKPTLARLFAIAHTILEQNIDYDSALSYKQKLLQRVSHTGQLLEGYLPFLKAGQGAEFLLRAYMLVIGVENMARPAKIVEQVFTHEPSLAIFKVDFSQEFATMLRALICYYEVR